MSISKLSILAACASLAFGATAASAQSSGAETGVNRVGGSGHDMTMHHMHKKMMSNRGMHRNAHGHPMHHPRQTHTGGDAGGKPGHS